MGNRGSTCSAENAMPVASVFLPQTLRGHFLWMSVREVNGGSSLAPNLYRESGW
jgi:hypothetical protein